MGGFSREYCFEFFPLASVLMGRDVEADEAEAVEPERNVVRRLRPEIVCEVN